MQTVDFSGSFTTVFRGQSYSSSFIDTGSNGFYFLDSPTSGLAVCTDNGGFYCPPSPQSLSAINRGINGVATTINFTIDNADTLLSKQQFSVFGTVGGTNAGSFDWGLPFFYGRTVFTAIEGQSTPGGTGPYWAY